MNHNNLALGKLPARPGAVTLRLRDYLTILPRSPRNFGHEQISLPWDVLGNDKYGDCVWAGAAHETMLWNQEASLAVGFSETSVLSDYSAVTGFVPGQPNTDQGTDMQQAASYRQKVGVVDSNGKRHQVGAYVSITPGDVQEHIAALYLFGAVGLGIRVPTYALQQFQDHKEWNYQPFATIAGGHYIPLVARRNNRFTCVTWGTLQPMTDRFFKHFNDESIAYISPEMLTNNKSPEGFNLTQLTADLAAL
jgi:hypothetical protein